MDNEREKVVIAIEEVFALRERLRIINALDFETIVWTEGGRPLAIPQGPRKPGSA